MSSINKKILIVSPEPSHPTYSGNRICIVNYTEMLREAGYNVYFLWVANFDSRDEEHQMTKNYWGDKLFVFRKNQLHRIIEAIKRTINFKRTGYYKIDDLYPIGLTAFIKHVLKREKFDSVIINYIFYSKIATYLTSEKSILYTHDVFTNKNQHTGSKWISVTANDEAKALDRVQAILAIQENEATFYRYLTKRKVFTTYSYFPLHSLPYVGKKNILYIAGPNQYNLEAIVWFIDNVFKELIAAIPAIRLIIGGRICTKLSGIYKNEKSITLYGDVSDLTAFYSLGDIVINPTFNGTGLKIKTFEALAYSKIVVCHSHNKIGIFNEHTAPLFIADDAKAYQKHISVLFSDEKYVKCQVEKIHQYMTDLNNVVRVRFIEALENSLKNN